MARRRTWSAAAKARVRTYYSYRRREKAYSEKYGLKDNPVSYKEFTAIYQNRVKQIAEGTRKSIGDIGGYIIKKENRPIALYEKYQDELRRRAEIMIDQGLAPVDGLVKSFPEFYQTYREYESDLKKEVAEGTRKSVGDIIGRIVSDQVYDISSRQYEAVYNAILEWNEAHPDRAINLGAGNKLSLQMKIRQGEFLENEGWWDLIRTKKQEFYSEAIKSKLSPKEANIKANKRIRMEMFGSPK